MEADTPEGLHGPRLSIPRGTVRVRTTVAAVAVVGVALAVGAVAMVTVFRANQTEQLTQSVRGQAKGIAATLASQAEMPPLAISEQDEQLIQVLDERGRVVASSSNMAGKPAVARIAPGTSAQISAPIDDGTFIAVAERAEAADGLRTVIVAQAVEDVADSAEVVANLLVIGLPLLLVVVGVTTWKVAGRALAPVENIRSEVDEISSTELHRRVPQPAGADEIARLAKTMNAMLDRLEQAQARQRRFISDASHELRSPVASIRQHAEVAVTHPESTTTGELADNVLAESLRVQALVEDLLLLARADERALTLRRRDTDLDDLVLAEADRLKKTTALQIDTSEVSGGRLQADPEALRKIVRNLADNATRHALGRVSFSVQEAGDRVILAVDDDGTGIPEDERQRIFERFVRLDAARARQHGGSGLGLPIVAELVSAHGGRIEVSQSRLGGARFEVELPASG